MCFYWVNKMFKLHLLVYSMQITIICTYITVAMQFYDQFFFDFIGLILLKNIFYYYRTQNKLKQNLSTYI